MGAYVELVVDRGSTFSTDITLTDQNGEVINLTSVLVSGEIRRSFDSANATESFTVTAVDIANGVVSLSLPYANTENMKSGRYVYDILLHNEDEDTNTRLIEGILTVTPRSTRPR